MSAMENPLIEEKTEKTKNFKGDWDYFKIALFFHIIAPLFVDVKMSFSTPWDNYSFVPSSNKFSQKKLILLALIVLMTGYSLYLELSGDSFFRKKIRKLGEAPIKSNNEDKSKASVHTDIHGHLFATLPMKIKPSEEDAGSYELCEPATIIKTEKSNPRMEKCINSIRQKFTTRNLPS